MGDQFYTVRITEHPAHLAPQTFPTALLALEYAEETACPGSTVEIRSHWLGPYGLWRHSLLLGTATCIC